MQACFNHTTLNYFKLSSIEDLYFRIGKGNFDPLKVIHAIYPTLKKIVKIRNRDLVLDIASNDSTLLQGYSINQKNLVGFDPTGEKFQNYYPDHIELVKDFFSAQAFKNKFENKKD